MRQASRNDAAVSTAAMNGTHTPSPSPRKDSLASALYAPQDRVHHKGTISTAYAGAVPGQRPARARGRPRLCAAQGPAGPPLQHQVLILCPVTTACASLDTERKLGAPGRSSHLVGRQQHSNNPAKRLRSARDCQLNTSRMCRSVVRDGPLCLARRTICRQSITASLVCCREAAIAYWGLCLHIGRPLPQNRHGHLIGHVKNTAKDPHNPDTRIYSTARAQPCAFGLLPSP